MSTVSLTFNLGVWRWGRSSPSQALMDLPRCGFGPFAFYGARFRLYTHLLRILSHFLSTPLSKLGLISLKHCVKHTFCLNPPIESIILCFFQVRFTWHFGGCHVLAFPRMTSAQIWVKTKSIMSCHDSIFSLSFFLLLKKTPTPFLLLPLRLQQVLVKPRKTAVVQRR